jgi:hypothetical protein
VIATRARTRIAALVIVAVAWIVHGRSIAFDYTYLDDRDLLVDDRAFLARPSNLLAAFGRAYMHVVDRGHAYYRPLVTASYGLDAQWSGVRPFGYHITNVALHGVASVLFFAVLRRTGFAAIVALGAALVFAVHPTLAAAVAWIPGRNDSLLAVFALAAWLFFLRDRDHASLADRALHFVSFAMALLTKETAFVLPMVWGAHVVLVERAARPSRARGPLTPYVVGWAAVVAARVVVHAPFSWGPGAAAGARAGVGMNGLSESLPILVTGLGKVVLPFNPSAMAVREDLPLWPGLLALTVIALGAWRLPGVRRRVVAFGAVAFVLLLGPVLAMPGTLILDSRLYLPACGVLLAGAEIARATSFERAGAPVERRLLLAMTAVATVVLGVVTMAYEASYRDRRAFAREAVASSPHSALAHFCLGQTCQIDGDADRALAEYGASLALAPGEVVHNNIAVIHMSRARWSEAEGELRDELAINPGYARAYENLAIVLHHEGREAEAQTAREKALGLEME